MEVSCHCCIYNNNQFDSFIFREERTICVSQVFALNEEKETSSNFRRKVVWRGSGEDSANSLWKF